MTEGSSNKGIIIKGIGGFYYVKTADGILECRAKGIFRKRGIVPLAGDTVCVEGDESGYTVSQIAPRKNCFSRPPIANVDTLLLIVSTVDPKPNIFIIDELIALSCKQGVKPDIVLTKTDIDAGEEIKGIYTRAGFGVYDANKSEDRSAVLARLRFGITVVAGNSGVGKTTLLNSVLPDAALETGETSKKLGRGRHTTRAVELYEYENGYIADTPGFSAVELEQDKTVKKEDIAAYFPDFSEYLGGCYFTGCSHRVEKGCGLLAALAEGKIERTRHESYCAMYKNISERNDWN